MGSVVDTNLQSKDSLSLDFDHMDVDSSNATGGEKKPCAHDRVERAQTMREMMAELLLLSTNGVTASAWAELWAFQKGEKRGSAYPQTALSQDHFEDLDHFGANA